jgi:hypothetical protein
MRVHEFVGLKRQANLGRRSRETYGKLKQWLIALYNFFIKNYMFQDKKQIQVEQAAKSFMLEIKAKAYAFGFHAIYTRLPMDTITHAVQITQNRTNKFFLYAVEYNTRDYHTGDNAIVQEDIAYFDADKLMFVEV